MARSRVDDTDLLGAEREDQPVGDSEDVVGGDIRDPRVYGGRARVRVADHLQELLARLLAPLAQQAHGQVGPVHGNAGLAQGRVATQVVHVEAVVDRDHPALAKHGPRPGQQPLRGLGCVRRAGQHQRSIRHLDQQRIGRPG
jgi:hypothetical protein